MNLEDLITPETIQINLQSTTKNEVLDEMIALLETGGIITDSAAFRQKIDEREALSSTAFEYGIAIPHGKSTTVTRPAIAFGRSVAGIDYGAEDGKTHYFFMIAVGENEDNLHLMSLAKLSRSLIHEEFRESLKNAQSTQDILNLIKSI